MIFVIIRASTKNKQIANLCFSGLETLNLKPEKNLRATQREINPRIARMCTKKYLASKQIRSVSVTYAKQYNHMAT